MGFLLGLALLTKVTAVLIIPPVLFFVSSVIVRNGKSPYESTRSCVRFFMILLGIPLIISGWYYLYNKIEMGRFFVGGWDQSRGIIWWQDPGYRTLQQCYAFGESLFFPVYSSICGFWDALYSSFWMDGYLGAYNRPPWNYDFMLSGAWLSLVPTAAILAGAVLAVLSDPGGSLRRLLRFSVCSVILYLAAIFYIFMSVPILSSAKASYALGLLPCFAILAARGFEVLTARRLPRAILFGLLACWAVGAYGAYIAI